MVQVPNLQWNDVILELDHADFLVKDRQGLSLLFTALRLGLQGQGFHPDRFPVDLLYRHWKHADSQVQLFGLWYLNMTFCHSVSTRFYRLLLKIDPILIPEP